MTGQVFRTHQIQDVEPQYPSLGAVMPQTLWTVGVRHAVGCGHGFGWHQRLHPTLQRYARQQRTCVGNQTEHLRVCSGWPC